MKFLFLIFVSISASAQNSVKLPDYCKSSAKKDKRSCDAWLKLNHKFINNEFSVLDVKNSDNCPDCKAGDLKGLIKDNPMKILWSKDLAELGQAVNDRIKKCSQSDLTPEEVKKCEELKSAFAINRMPRTGMEGPYLNDTQIQGCYFSSSTEILCPDGKLYEYTGKVNDLQRIKETIEKGSPIKNSQNNGNKQ